MRKTKTLCSIVILLILVFLLTACNTSIGENEVSGEIVETPKRYKFGYSCITMENPFFVSLESAIRQNLEVQGHTLITKNPKNDIQLQIQQIQEMIDEDIDAIFLVPVDWIGIKPAITALKEAGVKIINVDTQVQAIDEIDAYVGSDNLNAGKLCGEDLIVRRPDGGKIMILECPTMNSINERISGFEKAIKGKGFEVVARRDVQGDLQKALDATQEVLQEHPDISVIICGNDHTAIGALTAVNNIGKTDIYIYGVDGSPEIKKELLKEHTLIAATAGQSPQNMSKEAVKVAIQILNGEDYNRETKIETFLITKENVETYGVESWQ